MQSFSIPCPPDGLQLQYNEEGGVEFTALCNNVLHPAFVNGKPFLFFDCENCDGDEMTSNIYTITENGQTFTYIDDLSHQVQSDCLPDDCGPGMDLPPVISVGCGVGPNLPLILNISCGPGADLPETLNV